MAPYKVPQIKPRLGNKICRSNTIPDMSEEGEGEIDINTKEVDTKTIKGEESRKIGLRAD
eukprot:gnl/Chilomastix_caulleri/5918.p2 GENE.gnl/Chilomastix_caulleri/5918~~gnl/Chilomastix_caulleri/5918.p2  ORF type:complete len:60 (+),score=9.20 gnl/Chilomastix_caulleri/5918:205-384(+)